MKKIFYTILLSGLLWGCGAAKIENAASKTIELIGGGRLTVQHLPASYAEQAGSEVGYQYFRVIIHDKKEPAKTDWDYINFGLERDVAMKRNMDTLMPAVFQRMANGKKEVYEYLIAFQCSLSKDDQYAILLNDKVLGAGKQEILFP